MRVLAVLLALTCLTAAMPPRWQAQALPLAAVFQGLHTTTLRQAPVPNSAETTLVDNSTLGYYNEAIGTRLDGTQLQFPLANVGGGDPTIVPAPEPMLAPVAAILGNWLSANPIALNANWSGLRKIPMNWPVNTETAVVYPIDAGSRGVTRLKGYFGVDNGIFVWVNGVYKFGAIQPGPSLAYEYADIDLGSLPPGLSYVQILREDHGLADGMTIKVTGILEGVAGHILSPADNTTIGPSTLLFAADAWSNGAAAVGRLEFQATYDGAWHDAGVDTTPPYQVIWQTPNTLRSQQLQFAIHVVDSTSAVVRFADTVVGVSYLEWLGTPDVEENWVPMRAYLNQRSLTPNGDWKCSSASMAMVLAMNSVIDWDYATMSSMANAMYPRVLNAQGVANVDDMVAELERQGTDAEKRRGSADDAWSTLKREIDSGHPVIVRTADGVMTEKGHFFVAVGYRAAAGSRQAIAYDPYGRWLGTCCTNNYDRNTTDPRSRKGQWQSYDFDRAFGSYNWLIVGQRARTLIGVAGSTDFPTTKPDLISNEAKDIVTYQGVDIDARSATYLPLLAGVSP